LLAFPSRDHILKRDALLQKRFKADAAVIEDELDVLVARDRAILATFLYTGARIGSVHRDDADPRRFSADGPSR
jgi:hypothetical protein